MTQPTARAEQSPGPVDTARAQAAQVGQHAAQEGSQLAGTATDQAKQVAAEARRQARDLVGEARGQLSDQATNQQQKVAGGLRSLAEELAVMAAKGEQSGPATEVAHQVAERARQAAVWLEQREPGDLVSELRRVGRQHPGTFLLGAVIAGVMVGRLTRGAVASTSTNSSESTPGQIARPQPAVADYQDAYAGSPPLNATTTPPGEEPASPPPPTGGAGLDIGQRPLHASQRPQGQV
jgi:hypothetical protein